MNCLLCRRSNNFAQFFPIVCRNIHLHKRYNVYHKQRKKRVKKKPHLSVSHFNARKNNKERREEKKKTLYTLSSQWKISPSISIMKTICFPYNISFDCRFVYRLNWKLFPSVSCAHFFPLRYSRNQQQQRKKNQNHCAHFI